MNRCRLGFACFAIMRISLLARAQALMSLRKAIFGVALFFSTIIGVCATDYPDRPVKVVIPFSPGGSIDRIARIIEPVLVAQLGQPLVFDYRPGAGGTIGAASVAKSEPDGYTLLLGDISSLFVSAQLQGNASFDATRDFAPISQIANAGSVLVVAESSPARSVPGLIERARAHPGEFSFGSAGIGSTGHRAAEQLARRAGITLIHVPYKGGAPATVDLLAGRLSFIIESIPTVLPYIRSGQLRALGVTTPTRLQVLPGIPAIAEWFTGYSESNWIGLLAPAGTPIDIINRLNAAVVRTLNSDDARQRLLELGIVPVGDSPAEFADYLRRESARVVDQSSQFDLPR
jgi:tripartite-type tricarboxylate transporter receptor subunit TctC